MSAARSAGQLVRTAFATPRADSVVNDKSNSIDLVTNTDKECEKLIMGTLAAEFPGKYLPFPSVSRTNSDNAMLVYTLTIEKEFFSSEKRAPARAAGATR